MPRPLQRQALEDDLAFVERQIAEHADPYDTARLMWEKRREALKEEITALEGERFSRGRVALIFEGDPVVGSQEIKLDFASKVLENYESVVATLAAQEQVEDLGARGRLPGAFTSKLFITDMIRGSVGFLIEEKELGQQELLASPIKEAIEATTRILDDLSAPEVRKFEERLQQLSPRTVGAIKKLTKVLYDAGAETLIVDDESRLTITREGAISLQARLTDVELTERPEQREGILLGLFPERRQYEFKPAGESPVFYGPVSELLDGRYLADPEFARSILLKPAIAQFRVLSTLRAGRVERQEWILEEIELSRDLLPKE
jgi:hypothetical protein